MVYNVLRESCISLQASNEGQRLIQTTCIHCLSVRFVFMHQKVLGRQPSRYITESCEEFSKELWLQKKLQDSDKSFVPPFLKFQDQGCILIMHHAYLHVASSLLCDLMSIIRSIKKRVQSSLLKPIFKPHGLQLSQCYSHQ